MLKEVLVVDTPRERATYLDDYRLHSGAIVVVADDRNQALEFLGSERVGLVILDFTYEIVDRSATYFDVIGMPIHHSTPVLLLPNRKTLPAAEKLLQRPIDDIALKPISGAELARRTAKILAVPTRRNLALLVRLYRVERDDPFPIRCRSRDVGETGMFVLTQTGLEVGERVRIVLSVPNSPDPLELDGVVRRKEFLGQEVGYGIQFLQLLKGDPLAFEAAYGITLTFPTATTRAP